ncbi:hypothetical protein AKJ16_DCAP15356 [Drosera capensis]
MAEKCAVFLFTSILLSSGLISAVASPTPAAARIVGEIAVNMASTLFKWLMSFGSPTAKAGDFGVLGNSSTYFEGNCFGIDPYSVHATPTGELLILDSTNSNLYKVSAPLSPLPVTDSRPRILVGSGDRHSGHVDGKLREARMHHPRGMTG